MGRIFSDATPEQEKEFIEERRKSAFVDASKNPSLWYISARRHKRAADILYEVAYAAYEREIIRERKEFKRTQIKVQKKGLSSYSESKTLKGKELSDYLDSELLSEYLLLVGYSLECILKGYLISKQSQNQYKLDGKITNHKLVRLFQDCNIPLSPLEQKVLDFITLNVEWRKYPVPKELKKMPSPVEPSDDSPGIPFNPLHERKLSILIDNLYDRGFELLQRL